MGISRDSRHKRRATGGKQKAYRKKRKFELGRPAAMTKLGPKRIHPVRVRGGSIKYRALRLESGNFSWGSESVTRKTRLLGVVYNASNNELVRTNTLVKNSIIQVDATPFRQWYEQHYGVTLGAKKTKAAPAKKGEEAKPAAGAPAEAKPAEGEAPKKTSDHVHRKIAKRNKTRTLDANVEEQFTTGRLYAAIASRPGQSGRCDGYILEGRELEFYLKKLQKGKKGKGEAKTFKISKDLKVLKKVKNADDETKFDEKASKLDEIKEEIKNATGKRKGVQATIEAEGDEDKGYMATKIVTGGKMGKKKKAKDE